MMSTSRLSAPIIVVSSRLPFVLVKKDGGTVEHEQQSAGALVTAVCPSVVGKWIGWPGISLNSNSELIPNSHPTDKKMAISGILSEQVESIQVETETFDKFYNGCCNGTIWPIFHSMPDQATFSNETYKAYKTVNDVFSEKVLSTLRKCLTALDTEGRTDAVPLIWIHDYHLMLMAANVRRVAEEEGLRCKLGFFLHIPFPSLDIMQIFPWDDEILEGILGCDLVGFHIDDYSLNFVDCCQRRLGCRVDRSRFLVELDGRTIYVKSFPIGIPYKQFAGISRNAPNWWNENEQQIILSIDRLDYTKGMINRAKAFERLLEKHPEYLEKCVLLQVVVPSRADVKENQVLKEEMDQLIGRIKGRFTQPNWSPIRYIYGYIPQEELAAFYRDSAVAMVTPLRDGMNLVAKEFVACQNLKNPGVLILSPFAGAAKMMQEAIIVNPYEIDEFANKLHRALQMPLEERLLRMKLLQRREQTMDVNYWLNNFFCAVGILPCDINFNSVGTNNQPGDSTMAPLTIQDFDNYLSDYISFDQMHEARLNLILDYDGTLAPLAQKPELALMPKDTREILSRLAKNRDNLSICVISGRSLENLQELVNINGITYAGCHGLEILTPDGMKYTHPIAKGHQHRISKLLEALEQQVCKNGAWVENKGALLTFHYREVATKASRQELIAKATQIFIEHGFQPHVAPMALEAKPEVKWNRGQASIYILSLTYGADWSGNVKVIYCGDDQSDEEAMEALSGIAVTFKVSSVPAAKTSANYRLHTPEDVLLMLKWVGIKLDG